MAERKTSWSDTNRLNPFRPKYGQISSDRKHWWDGKKWVKNNPRKRVKAKDAEAYFGTGDYGAGGPKESERSKLQGKSNNNNKSKTTPKKGPVVKSVGTVDFNINTPAGLTSYNKALKASKGKKTDKERDKSTNKVLKEERDSNRNKISSNNKKKITARSRMRAKNEEIHGKSMQPLIDKHAAWKKARKEGTLGDWEKKYHPYRTPQYSNKKKSSSESTNRNKLKGEKTTNWPGAKPGGTNSQFNKDGTPKTKKSTPNPVKKKKKINHTGQPGGKYQFTTM